MARAAKISHVPGETKKKSMKQHVGWIRNLITEAGRELADPAGVAALAIRRMRVGALGPVPYGDRLRSRRRGSNLIKIDGWPLPGPCAP